MTSRVTVVLWVGLAVGLAGGLRCIGLLQRSLWFDEAMSWRTVILPWWEMFASIGDNTHAPLFFCGLKIWTGLFGVSLVALRGFNVAISLATVVLIDRSLAATGAASRSMRVIACGLFAASPLQIRLAGEVRMYPLFVVLAIVSTTVLWRMVSAGGNRRSVGVYVAAVLAMLYTHYFGLFVLAAQVGCVAAVGVRWRWSSPQDRQIAGPVRLPGWVDRKTGSMLLLSWGLIAAGWLPWLPVFLRQRQRVAEGWWTTDFGSREVGQVLAQWVISEPIIRSQPWLTVAATAFVLGTLVAAVLWGCRLARFAAAVSVLATGLAIGGSYWGTNVMVARYFGAVQMLWLISLAGWVSVLPGWRTRYVCGGSLVLVFSLIHVADLTLRDLGSGPGVRAAVAFVQAEQQPGEPFLVDSSFVYFPASFYAGLPTVEEQETDVPRQRRGWFANGFATQEPSAARSTWGIRLIDGPAGLPYYAGGPVIHRRDRMTHGELEGLTAERVWLLSGPAVQSYPLPPEWELERQAFFRGTEPFQERLRVASFVPAKRAMSPAGQDPG